MTGRAARPLLIGFAFCVSACGELAFAMLTSNAPKFTLKSSMDVSTGRLTLVANDYASDAVRDRLCDSNSSQDCEPDYFVGFAWFRSTTGPYGHYERFVDSTPESQVGDSITLEGEYTYRAGIVRRKGSHPTRIDEVSTAVTIAAAPCSDAGACEEECAPSALCLEVKVP